MEERLFISSIDVEVADYPDLSMIYRYWKDKRRDRIAPSRNDIDPLDFPEFLPSVTLITVERNPWRFFFRLCGTSIVGLHEREMTGKDITELSPPAMGQLLFKQYRASAESAQPACQKLSFRRGELESHYTHLLLPLSDDGEEVNIIWVVDSYRDQSTLRAIFTDGNKANS